MDKEKKEINMERKKKFIKEYDKVNAHLFQIHWNWEIDEDVGQIVIFDEVGKMMALWEENYIRIKELEDEWGFKKGQWMVIAVNEKGIVETYYGVYALGWIDENGIFQGIFFRPEDVLYASELDLPSEEQAELDELKELDELDVPEFDIRD